VADVLERLGPPIDISTLPRPKGPSLRRRPASPGRLLYAMRRPWTTRIGTLAGAMIPAGEVPSTIVSDPLDRVYGDAWPDEPFWACAVRLDDGIRVVLRRPDDPGAPQGPKVRVGVAVAASCAVPGWYSPVVIDGVRYLDGGLWSPTNADVLAKEKLEAVIISSPMSGVPRHAHLAQDGAMRRFLRNYLVQEVARLRARGMATLVIEPTGEDMATMGVDPLDPARRAPVVKGVRASATQRLRNGDLARRLKDVGLA
jgi:NTE family protein